MPFVRAVLALTFLSAASSAACTNPNPQVPDAPGAVDRTPDAAPDAVPQPGHGITVITQLDDISEHMAASGGHAFVAVEANSAGARAAVVDVTLATAEVSPRFHANATERIQDLVVGASDVYFLVATNSSTTLLRMPRAAAAAPVAIALAGTPESIALAGDRLVVALFPTSGTAPLVETIPLLGGDGTPIATGFLDALAVGVRGDQVFVAEHQKGLWQVPLDGSAAKTLVGDDPEAFNALSISDKRSVWESAGPVGVLDETGAVVTLPAAVGTQTIPLAFGAEIFVRFDSNQIGHFGPSGFTSIDAGATPFVFASDGTAVYAVDGMGRLLRLPAIP